MARCFHRGFSSWEWRNFACVRPSYLFHGPASFETLSIFFQFWKIASSWDVPQRFRDKTMLRSCSSSKLLRPLKDFRFSSKGCKGTYAVNKSCNSVKTSSALCLSIFRSLKSGKIKFDKIYYCKIDPIWLLRKGRKYVVAYFSWYWAFCSRSATARNDYDFFTLISSAYYIVFSWMAFLKSRPEKLWTKKSSFKKANTTTKFVFVPNCLYFSILTNITSYPNI